MKVTRQMLQQVRSTQPLPTADEAYAQMRAAEEASLRASRASLSGTRSTIGAKRVADS